MDPKETVFPESDAWAASFSEVRDSFATSSRRKTGVAAEATAADKEFKTYAAVDLSNLGGMGGK